MDGREGVWPLSGEIFVQVDNWPEPNPEKRLWIQLTWKPMEEFPNAYPLLQDWDPVEPLLAIPRGGYGLPDNWKVQLWEVMMQPNPPDERFWIRGDIYVDELVIDTWCVPEPSTLALLGIGAIGLLAYTWRRRRS